jgi:hypothetical protein
MVHKTPGCTLRAMWVAAILVSVAQAASAQDHLVLEPALHYFTRHAAGEIFEQFESVRPAAVSDAELRRILAMLPAEGNKRDSFLSLSSSCGSSLEVPGRADDRIIDSRTPSSYAT